jgi:hypothetical protein
MSAEERLAAASMYAASPRTLAGLHAAVRGRMVTLAAGVEFETKTGRRAPTVVDGWLPPKVASEEERYPFLIVRPRAGQDSEQGGDENARATIEIIVGTYGDKDDAWFDLLTLIDAIRNDLGASPAIQATAFEQVGPLAWAIPDEQTRPQWIGTVTTNWSLPRPLRVENRNPQEA